MYIKNKLLPFLLVALVAITSCSKQLNTNLTNPNGVGINTLSGKDVFAQALLSTVTNKIGADYYDYANQWMQYYSRNEGWASSGSQQQMEAFTLPNSFANGEWAALYHNIYDYNYVIGNSSTNSILPGASKVMKAMVFQDLVDQFGNIPYFQAANPSVNTTPSYDSASAIYADLIVQLDSAIASIQASQSTKDDASDIMFKGSKTPWLQLANTIKLRILLRQIPNVYKPTDTYVQSVISKITTQGSGFLGAGTDASVQPGFADASLQQNPFWGVYGFQPGSTTGYQNNNFFCANTFFISFLSNINDPRLGYFYDTSSAGTYLGEPFGSNSNPTTSPLGKGLLQSPTAPALLLTASQSLFMQAEAVQRGLMSGNVATLYTQAVEESFRNLGIANYASLADNYIANSTSSYVSLSSSTTPLNTILYQKWISECAMDGLEAWSDYRRTGIPVIATPSEGAIIDVIPTRLLYPESEYQFNTANVNAQNQASNPNAIYAPIFWQ